MGCLLFLYELMESLLRKQKSELLVLETHLRKQMSELLVLETLLRKQKFVKKYRSQRFGHYIYICTPQYIYK